MVCNAGNKLQIKPLTCSISMHTLFNGFTAFRGLFLFNWLVTWTNCSFKHLPFHLQQTCSWWLHHFLYLHAILRLFDLLFPAQWPYCMHRREGGVSFSSPMQTQHSRHLTFQRGSFEQIHLQLTLRQNKFPLLWFARAARHKDKPVSHRWAKSVSQTVMADCPFSLLFDTWVCLCTWGKKLNLSVALTFLQAN